MRHDYRARRMHLKRAPMLVSLCVRVALLVLTARRKMAGRVRLLRFGKVRGCELRRVLHLRTRLQVLLMLLKHGLVRLTGR